MATTMRSSATQRIHAEQMEYEQRSELARVPTRPSLRPPIGIPVPPGAEERGWRSYLLSFVLHTTLILLMILPPLLGSGMLDEQLQGAGGPGPAGGGGGGTRGTGGTDRPLEERLRYIQVAPTPAPAAPAVPETVPPPEEKKEETPPPVDLKIDAPDTKLDFSVAPGTGGGTGADGTAGTGPGSGGGVGLGVGTGRGSSTGPGTGGGPGTIYPPTPTDVFIPPMPVPQRIKGTTVIALFDVDETGNVVKFDFTETRDGGYNRRLREVFRNTRFRPATRWDGTPVRAQGRIEYTL
jgi:hypothetical protein